MNLSNFKSTLLEFHNKHKDHEREHKLLWLHEYNSQGRKVYYRVIICWDCHQLYFFDTISI